MTKSSLKFACVALLTFGMLLNGCDKNPTENEEAQKPTLPPASSMKVDLNLFTSSNLPKSGSQQSVPGLNFITARATVALINAAVVLNLRVPTVVLAAAFSQDPVLKADGKFHWIYTASQGNQQFQADLAGWIDVPAQESVWEMRITASTPPLNNFLWYEGRAKLTNISGYWDVYDATQPTSNTKILRIDWNVQDSTHATLEFTIVKPGIPENGDQLTYTANGNEFSVVYVDASPAATLTVFWNAATHAGYITAPNYNGGQKSCWDELLNDVTCP